MNIKSLDQLEKSNLGEYAKEQLRNVFGDFKIKTSKFRNVIVEIDGIKFRSKKEGQRYLELKMLMKTGDVLNFELQPVFILTKGEKKIRYFADFHIMWSDGRVTYEDVKGRRTALYKLKKQLVKDQYGIDIVET